MGSADAFSLPSRRRHGTLDKTALFGAGRDATYVTLADALDCDLLTADGRLSRAPGLRCAVTVIPA